ncbi:imidazolonepropionase [Naumannella halotolerans]|uniref:imidazolonepropionase n=1 Tax=Naumannella halotolerans TaxID=993414 RepID=UPI00370DB1A7
MSSTLITGITELITNDPDTEVPPDPALIVTDGRVSWIGSADRAPAADTALPAEGTVLPAFVDSHSHLVFDGDRSAEFTARMIGARYDGGGIATTVEATRAATDERLRALVEARVAEMRRQGTGVVEIKSGYGLNTPDELRSLRIAAEFTSEVTFLGAHVVPVEYRSDRAGYVDFVIGEMLQRAAEYARWIDVFCEPNSPHAFTGEESREILLAGRAAGLELRVHGNQLGHGPGAQLAVELDAASVDHCTYLSDADIDALAGSATVATVLPGVEFSTHSPYPDARKLIDSGVTVAIASDCNPGTCYSTSIPFMISLAVREMGMTPTEAVWAATRGSALSLRRDDLGVIKVGSPAELTVLDAPNHLHLAYRPGVPLARRLL